MADFAVFDRACEQLEQLTQLSRLEARGTMRIVLKEAGLDPVSVRAAEFCVVAKAILPKELAARGVADAESVCGQLRAQFSDVEDAARGETPEAVFARLGGGA